MKRGQAAMEFLMTYGWALLVVLAAIAALAFFGVLSPSRFLPESCNLGPGLACTDFRISDTQGPKQVTLIIRNSLGMNLNSVTISLQSSTVTPPCNKPLAYQGLLSLQVWNDGAALNWTESCGAGANYKAGGKFKADILFVYTPSNSQLSHMRVGQIVTKIED